MTCFCFFRIWIARKITLVLSLIVLTYQGLMFQDYNIINHQLLRDIQKQNYDLCQTVQFLKSGAMTAPAKDVTDALEADDEASIDENEDNLSFDSKMTDMTWRMDDFSDEDTDVIDDENFDTGKIFSKVKLSLVISTTFEFPAKKWTPNYLKMAHFKLYQI